MTAFDALEHRLLNLTLWGVDPNITTLRPAVGLFKTQPADSFDGLPGQYGEPTPAVAPTEQYSRQQALFARAVDIDNPLGDNVPATNAETMLFTGLTAGTYTHFALFGVWHPYSAYALSVDEAQIFPGATVPGYTVPSQTVPGATIPGQTVDIPEEKVAATMLIVDPISVYAYNNSYQGNSNVPWRAPGLNHLNGTPAGVSRSGQPNVMVGNSLLIPGVAPRPASSGEIDPPVGSNNEIPYSTPATPGFGIDTFERGVVAGPALLPFIRDAGSDPLRNPLSYYGTPAGGFYDDSVPPFHEYSAMATPTPIGYSQVGVTAVTLYYSAHQAIARAYLDFPAHLDIPGYKHSALLVHMWNYGVSYPTTGTVVTDLNGHAVPNASWNRWRHDVSTLVEFPVSPGFRTRRVYGSATCTGSSGYDAYGQVHFRNTRMDHVYTGAVTVPPSLVIPGYTVPSQTINGVAVPPTVIPPLFVPGIGKLPLAHLPLYWGTLANPVTVAGPDDVVVIPVGGISVTAN